MNDYLGACEFNFFSRVISLGNVSKGRVTPRIVTQGGVVLGVFYPERLMSQATLLHPSISLGNSSSASGF